MTDALTLYGALFLWAHYRACRLCPVSLDAGNLHLRHGLKLREKKIPLSSIVAVERCAEPVSRRVQGSLNVAGAGQPNVRIRLRQHVPVEAMYGMSRSIDTVYLGLDQPTLFLSAINALHIDGRLDGERD